MISGKEKKIISHYSQIIKISIVKLVLNHKFLDKYIDIENYCGACGIASFALYQKLLSHNINCNWIYGYHKNQEFEFGERHCWVECRNQVIDITYKQISNNNRLYIKPDKYVKIKENPSHRVFNKYWKWQNPYKFQYIWNDSNLTINLKGKKDGTSV